MKLAIGSIAGFLTGMTIGAGAFGQTLDAFVCGILATGLWLWYFGTKDRK